jgi:hypothetical protein
MDEGLDLWEASYGDTKPVTLCLFQCESHDIIVSDTPSDGDTKPTPSQVIDDFDSNDIIFDEAAIKEV